MIPVTTSPTSRTAAGANSVRGVISSSTSAFSLQTSDFRLQTSDFVLRSLLRALPANDTSRAVAGRQRRERVVDLVERVGPRNELAQLQPAFLIQRHEARDVARRLRRSVARSEQALRLHHARKHRDRSVTVRARETR